MPPQAAALKGRPTQQRAGEAGTRTVLLLNDLHIDDRALRELPEVLLQQGSPLRRGRYCTADGTFEHRQRSRLKSPEPPKASKQSIEIAGLVRGDSTPSVM